MQAWLRAVGAVATAATLTACGVAGGEPTGSPVATASTEPEAAAPSRDGERLLVSRPDGVVVVDPVEGEVVTFAPQAVASGDGSLVFRIEHRTENTADAAVETVVQAVDTGSADEVWSVSVPGWFEPRLADRTGSAVILGESRQQGETTYMPAGRATTTLVVVRDDGSHEQLVLDGNFEPESFTADSTGVFVISYLPALAPTEYQVRRLNLVTGQVEDVYSVDKTLQEAMGGTARTQAWAPDGRRLYTLYTVPVAHGEHAGSRQAFIHVLSQDELWAHCVDLPAPFGDAAENAVALAVSPDGDRLFVADRMHGTVAVVDTQRLEVVRTAQHGSSAEPGPAFATAAPVEERGTTVWLANGQEVSLVDGSSLAIAESVRLSDAVVGVAPSADGRRLYVGTATYVAVLDSTTLEVIDEIRRPELQAITGIGVGAARLDSAPSTIECAC